MAASGMSGWRAAWMSGFREDGGRGFLSLMLVFFAVFFLTLFTLIEFRPGFLEPLKKAMWSLPAASFILAVSVLSLSGGVVLLMPSRTGEYEEYSLGIALLFLGSISLSIALAILLDIM